MDIRPDTKKPRVTAGLTWQPDMGPSVYANARSTNPKASAVVTTPADVDDPVSLNPKLNVATPTATITNSAVRNGDQFAMLHPTSQNCRARLMSAARENGLTIPQRGQVSRLMSPPSSSTGANVSPHPVRR